MTVTTVIQAIIKAFGFGVRRYADGREVPNYRKGEVMAKPKEKMPQGKGKGKGKGPFGPKC
jgi:hypothetical protein